MEFIYLLFFTFIHFKSYLSYSLCYLQKNKKQMPFGPENAISVAKMLYFETH